MFVSKKKYEELVGTLDEMCGGINSLIEELREEQDYTCDMKNEIEKIKKENSCLKVRVKELEKIHGVKLNRDIADSFLLYGVAEHLHHDTKEINVKTETLGIVSIDEFVKHFVDNAPFKRKVEQEISIHKIR